MHMESTVIKKWSRSAGFAFLAAAFLVGGSSSDATVNCTAPDGSFIITSQEAANALSSCKNITGNVVVRNNDSLTQITFNGIEIIDGDLDASSCGGLQKISGSGLAQITNNFTLSRLPKLASLEFPLLDNVDGGIYWDSLPGLTGVAFGNSTDTPYGLPGTNVDGDISIANTALSSLGFVNFTHYSTPAIIWISGNHQLNNINLTGLVWGSNSLAIVDNGPSAHIVLSSLKSAGEITISNAKRLDIPILSQVNTHLIFSNNSIDIFTAPNLTAIGGNFIVSNNNLLTDVDLPLLATIGDGSKNGNFIVVNNTALDTITHLDQLWHTQGNITLSGNFSNVTLPSLRTIPSGFHINSSNPTFDCTVFDKLADQSSWTSASYSCGAFLPGQTIDMAKHYHVPDGGLRLSKAARNIIITVSVVAGLLLCGLLAQWVRRLRAKQRPTEAEETIDLTNVRSGASGGSEGGLGVTRPEEGDGLPEYRRVGKQGEVPPGYFENENGGTHPVESGNTGQVRARRRWGLW